MKSTTPKTIIAALIGGYVAISLGAIIVLALLGNNPTLASQEAWIHGCIVAATSILMALFARGALRGKAKAYLRLRITTIIMFIAIAITTAIPGLFPLWMKLEQIVCGLLLLGTIITLASKQARQALIER